MTPAATDAGGPRIGLLLGSQRRDCAARALYGAVRAETAAALDGGLSLMVAPEHLSAPPYTMLRPWPLLAALRAELGRFDAVGSVVAGLTSLAQLQADIETVDAAGEGSAGVALAAGYRLEDFAAAGRDFDGRYAARSDLRRGLAAHQRVSPDLRWSAASTVRAAEAAAGDGALWYAAPTTSPDTATAMATATDVRGVLRCDVLISPDSEAEARWRRYVAPKYGAYQDWGFTGAGRRVADSAVVSGSVEQVIERLTQRTGVVQPAAVVVRLCWPDMDPEVSLRHVRLFCGEVLPALRESHARQPTDSVGRV